MVIASIRNGLFFRNSHFESILLRQQKGTKLKEMTTAFKSKELFANQQKETYESQLVDYERNLLKVKEELGIMKMRTYFSTRIKFISTSVNFIFSDFEFLQHLKSPRRHLFSSNV